MRPASLLRHLACHLPHPVLPLPTIVDLMRVDRMLKLGGSAGRVRRFHLVDPVDTAMHAPARGRRLGAPILRYAASGGTAIATWHVPGEREGR